MAEASETPTGASIDRSERPGRVGLLLLLAALLVGAALEPELRRPRARPAADPAAPRAPRHGRGVLPVRDGDRRRPVQRAGRPQRPHQGDGRYRRRRARRGRGRRPHPLCQREPTSCSPAATASRICSPSSACSSAPRRSRRRSTVSPRRPATGAPRARRSGSRRRSAGGREFGWYRVRVRSARRARRPRPRRCGPIADVTHERERQENVFQELQHAIDYLDHAPAGFLSIDPDGADRLHERDARRLARLRSRPGRLRRPAPRRRGVAATSPP